MTVDMNEYTALRYLTRPFLSVNHRILWLLLGITFCLYQCCDLFPRASVVKVRLAWKSKRLYELYLWT